MEHGWKAERSHFRMRNAFGLFCYSTSLHMRVTECNFPWGWTESSYLSGTDQNRSFGRKTGVQWKLCQPPSPCFKGNSAKLSRFGTPTSVYFTLVPIWCIRPPKCSCFYFFAIIDPVKFVFPPSSIMKLHTHLLPSRPPLCCLASSFQLAARWAFDICYSPSES